jgi:hypothetical protein
MTEVVGTAEGADVEVAARVTSLPAVLEIPAPAPAAVVPQAAPVVSVAPVGPTPAKAPLADTTRVDFVTRLRETLVSIVPHAQYRLTRLGTVGIAGIATLLAAVAITVSALIPGQNAISALNADIARAMKRPPSEATPEEGLGKLVAALPTRGQMPAVIGLVLQQAQQAGVPLDVGHYAFVPAKTGSVGRYELEFPVRASYPQVRDFINRTLTAVPAAGLDKLRIERKSVADQTVNADVRFVVFVRGE